MVQYKYQIHEVQVMSFRTNDSQQISMFDSFNLLTEREQKALVKSWAKVFAEEIFPQPHGTFVQVCIKDGSLPKQKWHEGQDIPYGALLRSG